MMSSNLPDILCVFSLAVVATGCNFDDSYEGTPSEQEMSSSDMSTVDMGGPDLVTHTPDASMTPDLADLADPVDVCIPLPETCNAQDDDCDGEIDEGCDADDDGYCVEMAGELVPACPMGAGDCDDDNPLAFPGSPHELCGEPLDLDCDGKLKTFALTDKLIQPQLPEATHGAPMRSMVLAVPGDDVGGSDANALVLWLEKREVQELWIREYTPGGSAVGEPIQLAEPLRTVSHFNAVVDPHTGLVGVAYYQKQSDEVFALMFMLLNSKGEIVLPATAVPFDQGSQNLPNAYFSLTDYPEMHVQNGIFSLFFPFVDDTILDYYHIAYDHENTEFIGRPKRIYSTTTTYLTPVVGWRQPEGLERAGNYLIGQVDAENKRIDLFELDPLSNEIAASFPGRSRDQNKNIVGLSSGMDTWYIFEATSNTASPSPYDVTVSVAAYERARGGFAPSRPSGIDDLRQTGNKAFTILASSPTSADIFYHSDLFPQTGSPTIGLSHADWSYDNPGSLTPIPPPNTISGHSWTMAYLRDDASLLTLDLANDESTLAALQLSTQQLDQVPIATTSTFLLEAPELSPYPYPTMPSASSLTTRRADNTLQWMELYFEEGKRKFKLYTLPEDGSVEPVRLIGSPEPMSTASLYGGWAGEHLIVYVPTSQQVRDGSNTIIACTQAYALYEYEQDLNVWTLRTRITLPMTPYTSNNNNKACPTASVGSLFAKENGDPHFILTYRYAEDPLAPTTYNDLKVSSRIMPLNAPEATFDPAMEPHIDGFLTLLSGIKAKGYVVRTDEEALVSSLELYDLNAQDPAPLPFYSKPYDPELEVNQVRLNAVPDSPHTLALHLTQRTRLYTGSAELMLFDSLDEDPAPQRIDLGELPINRPSWTVSYHDAGSYEPLYDGEKFVFSYYSIFSRQNISSQHFQRFLRVVWPEDARMAPEQGFFEIPAMRSYTFLHTLPIEQGVLVLYQDDISHHALQLNETLDVELQRLTWTFDAGVPPYSEGAMPQSSHVLLNTRRTDAHAWQWQLWAQPEYSNSGYNTFYQTDMTCLAR